MTTVTTIGPRRLVSETGCGLFTVRDEILSKRTSKLLGLSLAACILGRVAFSVEERQFEAQYAPIACGLQLVVLSCSFSSLVAALWWFLARN